MSDLAGRARRLDHGWGEYPDLPGLLFLRGYRCVDCGRTGWVAQVDQDGQDSLWLCRVCLHRDGGC